MVDSRDKGKRAEYAIRDMLKEKTGLGWERVPGSGGFGAQHGLKGDIYLPHATGKMAKFAIEVKHYKDEQFNSNILKDSSSQFDKWLDQTYREAEEMSAKPMLVFRKDRGAWLVALDKQETDAFLLPDPYMTYYYGGREVAIMDFKELLKAVSTEWLVK